MLWGRGSKSAPTAVQNSSDSEGDNNSKNTSRRPSLNSGRHSKTSSRRSSRKQSEDGASTISQASFEYEDDEDLKI